MRRLLIALLGVLLVLGTVPAAQAMAGKEQWRESGKVQWVQIDLGDDNHDHLIDPDERMRIAMAQQ